MRAKKYQEGGGVGDPPQGTITPQQALERLAQLQNPDRLRGGDAPFRTIKQEKDRMAAEGADEGMFELIRMFPVIGEAIDLVELGKVNLTGKDLYGGETDKDLYNTFAAAGLVIPNVLEGPLKYLLRKGARNVKDVNRILYNNPDALELAPLKELQQKADAFESRLSKGARPTYEATRQLDEFGDAASPERGARNWMLENDPDLLIQFTPEAYDQGMFDRRMQEFGDQYLTMYRGVNAPDVETASRYMLEAPKGAGIGGQNAGPGIYGTSDPSIVKGGRGSGYTGTLRTAPDVAQSFDPADRIISDLVRLEREGMLSLPMDERRALSDLGAFPGMRTSSDRVRVVRSLPASQQKILDISSPGEEFVPRYKSDFGGAGGMLTPYETQRGLETSFERLLPLIEGYNKGGKVVKYKR
jgi:hypothetical protein